MSEETCRGVGHELRADTQSFEMAHDVQVFEKGSPLRVVVEDGMSEADDSPTIVGDNRVLEEPRRGKTIRPDLEAIGDDIAIEVRIQVCPAVVATPALSVKQGDAAGIPFRCFSVLHDKGRSVSVALCIRHFAPSSFLALAPCRSRLPDRRRARSLGSLLMNGARTPDPRGGISACPALTR
jgi:hypothetical protein